ncbi:MAG TPA: DUF2071 domain-containing protein [Thermoanaerobaculia bacterium]|nr:DUF2071 domain-containing protein [Thermoanaerobaculia bacterium]
MHQHDTIDRITPTLEPDQPVLMYQNWHHLAFLHWEVPAAELQKLIPSRLTIDTYEGRAYVGLVPFTVSGARPVLAPPLPGVSNFHEINVRTYVHHEGTNPGVWFFSLDAASTIAVAAARAAYHLNYFHAPIEMTVADDALPLVDFRSHRDDPRGPMPAHAHLRYRPTEGPSGPAAPGTLEHFLAERYILYAENEHQLYRARVHHQPYPLQRAEVLELDETLIWAAGIKRGQEAPIRHYAREVNVKVYPAERVGTVGA